LNDYHSQKKIFLTEFFAIMIIIIKKIYINCILILECLAKNESYNLLILAIIFMEEANTKFVIIKSIKISFFILI